MFLFQSSDDKKVRQDVQKHLQICFKCSEQRDQPKYIKSMQTISKYIQKNNQKVIQSVVDQIKITIKEDQNQPVRKYLAIKLLRDLMKIQVKNKSQNLGKYVVKKILKRLSILASHRSNSNDQERGRDIFKSVKKAQQKYSILFLNELLLSIQQWAKTWPGASEGTKRQFNQTYKQLITNGVQFPKQVYKVPPPANYRVEDQNRKSVSPYNSLAQKQSFEKKQQKSPLKSQVQKAQKKVVKQKQKSSSFLEQKVNPHIQQHFETICSLLSFFVQTLKGSTQMNSDEWDLVKSIIQQLPNIVSKGDEFIVQFDENQIKTNFYAIKIQQTFQFKQSVTKDIKKTDKHLTQFPLFKKKYLNLSTGLMKSLKQKKHKVQKKEKKIQQQKKSSLQQITQQVNKSNQLVVNKRLSIPKVRPSNMYNSVNGQANDWVIHTKQQYNSNKGGGQQQFGSFGVGGIGQKVKKQNTERSAFAQQALQNQRRKKQTQKIQQQQQNNTFSDVSKTIENKQAINNIENSKKMRKQSQKIPKNNEQFYLHEPLNKQKSKNKVGSNQVNHINQTKKPQQQQSQEQSANFFGNFGSNKGVHKNSDIQPLPGYNRDSRRIRTKNTHLSQNNNINNEQNPFELNMNSKVIDPDSNFSAFNKDKSSLQQVSQSNPFGLTTSISQKRQVSNNNILNGRQSFELNQIEQNKSQQNKTKSINEPNFFDGEQSNNQRQIQRKNSNPFSDKVSFTQKSQRSINPFQDTQLSKKSNNLKNPFEDDDKSQLSKQNRSVVNTFQVNQSFVGDKSNPFETTYNNNDEIRNKIQNPFNDDRSLSKVSQNQNPFQTSDFKPTPVNKFVSVSQRNSFKNIQKIQKDTSIQNPFQTKKNLQQKQNVRQSWNFSVKNEQQNNQGFQFDQFQNIGGNNRQSVKTSDFKKRKDSVFSQSQEKSKSISKNPFEAPKVQQSNNQQHQKSIHFSQFGDESKSVVNNKKKQDQKSINFDDFDNIPETKKGQKFNDFSDFQNNLDNKKSQKKSITNKFQATKSQNDFFKSINKDQRSYNDKPQDNKSRHSQFSGFNMNFDNKSENKTNKSGLDWDDFQKFNQPKQMRKTENDQKSNNELFVMNTDRSNETVARKKSKDKSLTIDTNHLKINLSQNNSNFHSPNFNVVYDSFSNTQKIQQQQSINSKQLQSKLNNQKSLSIRFEQFNPIQKKGQIWNPLGIQIQNYTSRIYNVQTYDIEQKKKQMTHYKTIYTKQKQLLQHAKQLYNQARQVYLQKINRIDQIIKQQQSYKRILVALKQSNHSKQEQMYAYNERIKKVSELKQKILQKQKLLFQKTKIMISQEQQKKNKFRPNNNKWEIFNRNLKIMRQRQNQNTYKNTNTKIGYSYSRA